MIYLLPPGRREKYLHVFVLIYNPINETDREVHALREANSKTAHFMWC